MWFLKQELKVLPKGCIAEGQDEGLVIPIFATIDQAKR